MDTLSLLAVAVGLAMDAFAAAVGVGLSSKGHAWRCAARVGVAFGLFQAGMTLAGWLAGSAVSGWASDAGRWIAAALLWAIAARMILAVMLKRDVRDRQDSSGPSRASLSNAVSCPPRDPSRGLPLLALAVATSIDAFGAGAGFAMLAATGADLNIWLAAGVIGAVAAVLPGGGVFLARRVAARTGGRFARAAEVTGALVLAAIGVRIAFFGG